MFYYILAIELLMKYKDFLTVVYIVTNCNNGDIHRSLKCCIQNCKTSLKNIEI